ncbi:transposase [Luteimonas yanweni]
MPTPGPRTTYRYTDHFKATAVRLSELPGVSVADVAESLYIHPFMLSRWRKLAREGVIVTKGTELDKTVAAELKALREVKRKYERLRRPPAFSSGRPASAITTTRRWSTGSAPCMRRAVRPMAAHACMQSFSSRANESAGAASSG